MFLQPRPYSRPKYLQGLLYPQFSEILWFAITKSFFITLSWLVLFTAVIVQLLSHVRLFHPMHCSRTGLPVPHQHPEFAQVDIHWITDAIQPSHPAALFSFCLQSFPASGSFLMSWLFTSGGQSIKSFSIRAFKKYSGADFPLDWLVWSCCPRDCQESSLAPRFESINSLVLSLLSGPTLTSLNDYFLFIM